MANSNPKLLVTQNPFSVFLLTFLLLITNVKSDSFSFNFPKFDTDTKSIIIDGDANTTNGVLQLTKKDQLGNPSPHSFGLSFFLGAIHLSDKQSGKVADFTTEFSFVVNPKGSQLHGDGFTFFIASLDYEFPEKSSDGGFLGLFDKESAFNTSQNSIVAVEFDSFRNEWDPQIAGNSPHIGIDINTIRSSATALWPIDRVPEGSIGKAHISYNPASKKLTALVTYLNGPVIEETAVSYTVDFAAILPEYVLVGFSGATGELAETHDILSWSFTSNL
ncbi:putative concanavalin A-like lectin/glucanase domain, legume lectin [Medicago truncatula]|uniref:Lectin 8 n=1 Tax=Medicago truncatula TaxID=3880 RepID=LEC8_MEDTR|nr:lectin 8 precursor [Medicago truncatula]Q2PP75.1 RecName: Full=Lectin 8; Short=MtLec8; AltName: Full=Agglutinin LEC8; Flags: Precursor [Medicago truncatula]ABC47814.1 lectin-like protein [Medicago truncatula]RHN54884.1 putative concanavalin A-like lectin/glucanase domain, legume lectin [Medicago truncatula]